MASVTFQFGSKEIILIAVDKQAWDKGDMSRVYFDLKVDGKANPVFSLYEVITGGTSDNVIKVNGRKFAYEYGFCDSKSKRRAVDEAITELVKQL